MDHSAERQWFHWSNFFSIESDHPLSGRLKDVSRVWEIPERLISWINDSIRPNVKNLIAKGGFIREPTAMYDGQPIHGIEYILDGKDGIFQVWHGDVFLAGATLLMPGVTICDERVEIGPGVLVESGAMLKGPTILGADTQIRQGAYVRGGVFTGEYCLIGHATEVKNSLLLDRAKAGHFAYIGDSVLGRKVNLGAGTKLANLKLNDNPFRYRHQGELIEVAARKMGAVLGDGVVTGCNSVTNPGTLLGPNSRIMPNITAGGGYFPADSEIGGR
ncbi:MAG: glucose-1-phosphate thymidylyltransferase [Deltaproteobacteria bacterium]|jgi:acetyltransferase-like isoleucine patch superfamily enzyme|nr:glucose-1-phosphate thymidylyltransferase [Deltaproteobacteria bacterium]